MLIDESDYLEHYGILRKSGRYPWGSGSDAPARSRDFLGLVEELRNQGMSESEIAKSFSSDSVPFTTTDLRATVSIARNQQRAANISQAQRLKATGMSNGAIAEEMHLPGESSVRALLEPSAQARTDQLTVLSNYMKDEVANKGYVEVGIGVERYTGSSRTQFDTALAMLKSEDYTVTNVQVDQLGTGNKTTLKVLGPPSDKTAKETYIELVTNQDKIKSFGGVQTDDGKIIHDPPPLSIDSSRVGVNYSKLNDKGEEIGGGLADGVIYVRPGVNDVTLGGSQYAQVRVAVDGTHYLKGMAVYKDDLPPGVDLVFNTNKSDTGNKLDALKPIKSEDPNDLFGAVTKPILNPDGTRKSVMNIVNAEGDWSNWSKSLATQMLSKQKPTLAKEQLDLTYKSKKQELDEILALTNPSVRKKLLQSFSDDVDSSAVHLKAAALPRQATQVIMPVSKMKETEVYAPNFKDGERVVLIRYPHGGTFEIPELTVNNRNAEAVSLLGKAAKDAIGIHPKVAERLSGADFDGDTVLVIPNNSGKIKSKPALEALKKFDPKREYPAYEGMPAMSPKKKQTEMGKISNLITDMTIKGANDHEIARAVRHSMVVIDAEKHKLNYKQSALDNNIAQLKAKYQGGADKGATTLISRTSREINVPKRKAGPIDKETGKKTYVDTGEGYISRKVLKDGTISEKFVPKTTKSKEGAEVEDAFRLTSAYDSNGNRVGPGTPIEKVYADHSNRLKTIANTARKEMVNTSPIPYSPSANKAYAKEVGHLKAQLNIALKNAPKERQAQLLANETFRQKRDANPDMGNDEIKKLKGKELINARARVGAKKDQVTISEREWEAIQAGAVSGHMLDQILNNADIEVVKSLATPRKATVMTDSKQAQARQLLSSGRTPSEVAEILGVPLSTLQSSLK